ncbi:MAG TPA: TAT-variant-translocated molybdopterin oxidoreductase [Candidatus Angelobacter sp.]|nr:TAT-variant-translocated molybdopterin oxidoreductase [Candidatus Angelobacter sp.]
MSNKGESNRNLIPADAIKPARLELDEVRQKLAGAKGPKYWRTLEELSGQQAFGELLEREFPRQHSEWLDPVSRRDFMKLAGASLALAGLAGCTRQPLEQILPYVRQPEELVPGRPIFYATAMPFAGYALPLLVETHEFRPTKVEGNPQHGCSLGATDLFAQASVLNLYDPDRSTVLTFKGEPRPWGEFLGATRSRVGYHKTNHGAGLRFLTGAVSSPTMGSQMKAIQQIFPQSKWHRWEPVHRDGARAGSRLAFGAYFDPQYKFDAADVVVSLDADFLSGSWFPGFVRYARDFMSRRKLAGKDKAMNRLYVAESSSTTTGAKADHRLPVEYSRIEKIARALAAKVGVAAAAGAELSADEQNWVNAVAVDLTNHRGRSLVVAGEFQTATVNALAHAMNAALDNAGKTVSYTDPVEIDPVECTQSIGELVSEINAGKVETLVILGGNPAYDAPSDLSFIDALNKLLTNWSKQETPPSIIQLSLYNNDTTDYCHWHVQEAHYLESWGDCRAHDGTVSIIQPMILPLYGGKSAYEILAIFTDQPDTSGYDLLRSYWRSQHPGDDFETWWRKSVHDGYISNSVFQLRQVSAKLGALPEPRAQNVSVDHGETVEITFRPDPTIYDGSFINNGWLQETPKPMSRTTWDNVAMISTAMAERLKLLELGEYKGDHQSDAQRVLELTVPGAGKIKVPYWPQPGHPDNSVTLFLGYGQNKSGRVGTDTDKNAARGYNAYSVRGSGGQYVVGGGSIAVTNEYYSIAVTQGHFTMDGREPVRAATLDEYKRNPMFVRENTAEAPQDENESLYPNFREKGWYQNYAWAMAIDLNSCVGCQACAVACQSENNLSIVGKEQVQRGREMQWIRIDAYYEGDPRNPNVYFQPVPCMQCENAPCEPVCPVGATVHSTEGLNDMVYNRCVGTRYCSNNCPYKVRRFNFLLFADFQTPSLKMMRNPDVSVRSRGVMEKCTYCVQRINAARIASEKENRRIRDGEILTACQQVCPTEAITFGDKNDPTSRVSKLKADARDYPLLAELNTRPRTTYTAAVRNPNPDYPEKA